MAGLFNLPIVITMGGVISLVLLLAFFLANRTHYQSTLMLFLYPLSKGLFLGLILYQILFSILSKAIPQVGSAMDYSVSFLLLFGSLFGLAFMAFARIAVNKYRKAGKSHRQLIWAYMDLNNEEQNQVIGKLSRLRLFEEFPHKHIHQLIGKLEIIDFQAGETLLGMDSPNDSAFVVLKGDVEIRLDGATIANANPKNSIINLNVLLTNDAEKVITATCLSDVRVLSISRAGFDELRNEYPQFDRHVKNVAQERLEDFEHWVEEQSIQLKDWAANAKQLLKEKKEITTKLPLYQQQREKRVYSNSLIASVLSMKVLPPALLIGAFLGVQTFHLILNGQVLSTLQSLVRPLPLVSLIYLVVVMTREWSIIKENVRTNQIQYKALALSILIGVFGCWATISLEPLLNKPLLYSSVGIIIGMNLQTLFSKGLLIDDESKNNYLIPIGLIFFILIQHVRI